MWLFSRNVNAKIDDLIFKLKDSDPSVRESSVRKMIALGKPAVEPLIQYLQHPDKWARLMAAAALGKMKEPRAIKPLEQALDDPDEGVRYMAQTALNELRRI
jgi:HEAT repeat protein